METEKQYYKYWGKYRKNSNGKSDFHLLPYHCLDVAAVGCKLYEKNYKLIPSLNIIEEETKIDVFSLISCCSK